MSLRGSSGPEVWSVQNKEGKRATNLNDLGKFLPEQLFIIGWSAVANVIYDMPVGSPENTCNSGEDPNIHHSV